MNVWLVQEQRNATLELDGKHATLIIGKTERLLRLFDATVTGGEFRKYLLIVRSIANAALLIEPCRQRFILPCKSGTGQYCEEFDSLAWQLSTELCCEYACNNEHNILLRDTRETILKKVELAQAAGISTIMLANDAYEMITAPSK